MRRTLLALLAILTVLGIASAHGDEVDAPSGMTIELEASEDFHSGYNLHLQTIDFRFTPEKAGEEPTPGEGYAYLYVDSQKRARVYGEYFHLEGLEPGEHELRVTLNASNDGVYVRNGEPVEARTSVTAAEAATQVPEGAVVFELGIGEDGRPAGDVQTFRAQRGDTVAFLIDSAVAGTAHLHGYDLPWDLTAGNEQVFSFEATAVGRFPLEMEETGVPLGYLEVRP
jgi:hypothetical protein